METLSSGWSESAVPRMRARPGNDSTTSLGFRQKLGSSDHTYNVPHHNHTPHSKGRHLVAK